MATRLAELMRKALALSVSDRLTVALRIWESIDEEDRVSAFPVGPAVLAEVRLRDEQLLEGAVAGRTHDDVMTAARNAIR